MNHHIDTQIQACTNEDSRVCGIQTLKIQIFTWNKLSYFFSRTRNGNVIVFFNIFFLLRTRYDNAIINCLNHHCDMQIQTCTKLGCSVYRVETHVV